MKRKQKIQLGFGLLLILAAVGVYVVGVVYDCRPLPFDLAVQNWFFSLRSSWLNPIVIGITHLGDPVSIVAFCALLLILPSRKTYGLPVSLGALTGLVIYKPLKHFFLRARPDVALHLVEQGGYSFPSGHSVTSVIVFGLLAYLLWHHCRNERLRKWLTGVCIALACLIGLTRIFVGVHWPTDVLTGWCIGGAVLCAEILILERRAQRD